MQDQSAFTLGVSQGSVFLLVKDTGAPHNPGLGQPAAANGWAQGDQDFGCVSWK